MRRVHVAASFSSSNNLKILGTSMQRISSNVLEYFFSSASILLDYANKFCSSCFFQIFPSQRSRYIPLFIFGFLPSLVTDQFVWLFFYSVLDHGQESAKSHGSVAIILGCSLLPCCLVFDLFCRRLIFYQIPQTIHNMHRTWDWD